MTAGLAAKRLQRTTKRPVHVAEMALTSMAIPPVAVFWRLAGAMKYRVWFW